MSGLKFDKGEWIVVADGARALVLENVGDRKFPDLRTYSQHVRDALRAEVEKDYVKMPVDEIARHLAAA